MIALSQGADLLVDTSGELTVTHDTHKLYYSGGSSAVDTVNPPSPAFSGKVLFFNNDVTEESVVFTTGGNIGRESVCEFGTALELYYNATLGLWFPLS